jgi:hypothetical protein
MIGMVELTVRQARDLLIEYAAVLQSRDDRVRTAYVSGVSKSEISRLTGIARTTIDRIIDSEPLMSGGPQEADHGPQGGDQHGS